LQKVAFHAFSIFYYFSNGFCFSKISAIFERMKKLNLAAAYFRKVRTACVSGRTSEMMK